MLHFMRCPLPSQCSLEGPLLLLIPDLVANPTWGGVSVYYGFLADLLEPEASSWFWVGVRLIWATPSQPGSLLGRETNLAVCLSSRRLLWKTYDLPPRWVGGYLTLIFSLYFKHENWRDCVVRYKVHMFDLFSPGKYASYATMWIRRRTHQWSLQVLEGLDHETMTSSNLLLRLWTQLVVYLIPRSVGWIIWWVIVSKQGAPILQPL